MTFIKLFYITSARMPTEKAYGYQISKMCESFARNGLKVRLIFPKRCNIIKDDLFVYYKIEKKFQIKEVPVFDFIKYDKLFFRKSFYLFVIFYIFKLIRLNLPSQVLIYTRDFWVAWLFKKRGYKVIFEMHSKPSRGEKLFFYFLRDIDKIITVTECMRQILIKNGIKSSKVITVADAVDLEIFDINLDKEKARKELRLPLNKVIILYTGNFRTMGQEKGVGTVIESLKFLPAEVIFVGVGGTSEDINYYQNLAQKNNMTDRVFFLKRVDLKVLAKYQKAADILVMPFPTNLHYDCFMSPLKMFEYLSAERPIIASSLRSVREILNQNNAILVKPGDCYDLAKAVKRTIKDKNLAHRIAFQAKKDASKYTWDRRAEKILEFIN